MVVQKQSIGVASTWSGFASVDGILGLGPVDLTEDTVANTNTVPTFADNLFAQGIIPTNEIAFAFEPATSLESMNGLIAFGGQGTLKYLGEMYYT
jgi:hypothetical protein